MVGQAGHGIDRVRYTHDAMIDLIISEPSISQNNIAKFFGYSVGWISQILTSDSFQARLHQRRAELVDPIITNGLEERFKGLAMQSLQIVQDKLDATKDAELAIKALELSSKALGFGARAQNVAIQQNFVVHAPQKAESSEAWAREYAVEGGKAMIIEIPPVTPPVLEKVPEVPRTAKAVGTGEVFEIPKPRALVGDKHLQQDMFE